MQLIGKVRKMKMIKTEFDPTNLTNEELNLLVENLQNEKKRREKEKKYQVALNLRNALRDFLDCGAECDYSMVYGMSGCDLLDLEVECESNWYKDDLNYVEFDPFDSCLLKEIMNELKFNFNCYYEEKDSIGKRYRRMDAIGTPYCVTVDHQTLEDGMVTLRERDTMEQRRVAIADLRNIIQDNVSITSLLKKLS